MKGTPKEFNFRFILIASSASLLLLALLSLFGYLFYRAFPSIKDHYATYNVSGRVLEYGSQAAVPDFKLDNGALHMYSTYEGAYLWESLDKASQISFAIPEDYEGNASVPIDYSSYKELSPFKRSVTHNFYIVLGVDKTADRVLAYLKSGSHSNIWVYLSSGSQNLWSDKEHDFTTALDLERSLRKSIDQSQLMNYEILNKTAKSDDLGEFSVKWERANGTTFVSQERFVKENGWWHYEWQRDPKDVYVYIDRARKLKQGNQTD